jgi:hypothetical protein
VLFHRALLIGFVGLDVADDLAIFALFDLPDPVQPCPPKAGHNTFQHPNFLSNKLLEPTSSNPSDRAQRHRERKTASLAHFTFHPDSAAVRFHSHFTKL